VYTTIGRYFAGSLVLAVMNGIYILAVGLALGVPLAFLAAVWAMLTNLIPQVGGFLGGSVFVTLALTSGVVTGLLALVLFLAYMITENYVIQPTVVGSAINLSPPTTMLAAFVGAAAAGVPGALVTTPIVAAVKELYLQLRFGSAEQDGGHSPPRQVGVPVLRRLLARVVRRR
jgi:predicted PurR-regulated permease PerM